MLEEERASNWVVARRLIPWVLVNTIMIPLTTCLIFIGYGKEAANDFRNRNT